MSGFHEAIKSLIAEFEKFLTESLKNEKMGKSAKVHKQEIIDKIAKLKDDWPALGTINTDQVRTPKESLKDDESTRTGGSSNTDEGEDPYSDSSADIPNVQAMELTDFIKAGFLEKKKPTGLKNMQKRWCVIKGNIFYYFADKTSKKMSGAFRLTDYSFEWDEKKKSYFKLVRPANRTYEFLAQSKTEADEWKRAVQTGSSVVYKEPEIEALDDDGDIYEPVGGEEEPEEITQDFYDDGMTGDIYEAEPAELIQEDIYDEGSSAPIQEEEYEDASTPSVAPSLPAMPPPARRTAGRPPPPPTPDEDPYQSRPLPPVREPRKIKEELPPPPPPEVVDEEPKSYRNEEDFENMFIGKWDCFGDNEKELSFKKGDIVYIINRDFDDRSWWVGELDGKFGLVPKNYLTGAYELTF